MDAQFGEEPCLIRKIWSGVAGSSRFDWFKLEGSQSDHDFSQDTYTLNWFR